MKFSNYFNELANFVARTLIFAGIALHLLVGSRRNDIYSLAQEGVNDQ